MWPLPSMLAVLLVGSQVWAQSSEPSGGDALIREAAALAAKGDLDGAEAAYKKLSDMTAALRFESIGLRGLFDIYAKRGRPEEGMTLYRDRFLATKNYMYLALGAGRLVEAGKTDLAEQELAPVAALLTDGSLPFASGVFIAEVELQLNHSDLALKAARIAQRGYSGMRGASGVWATAGLIANGILNDLGRTTEAINELELILDAIPDERRVLTRLAFQLAVQNKELARARTLAEKALTLPDAAPVYNSSADEALGIVLLKQGQADAAVRSLAKALRRNPRLNAARNYMTQALRRMQNPPAQAEELSEALRKESSNDNARTIIRLLEGL